MLKPMKPYEQPPVCRLLVIFLMLFGFLVIPRIAVGAGTTNEDWNVAVLDQLLASVPPGQTVVQIDDMEISVSYLQQWRNTLAGGPQPNVAFSGTFTKWPGGNVYYQFDSSVSGADQRAFLDAAAEWATFANLHFIARTSQANYLLVTNNAALGGGLSYVGMEGGAQLYQIGPNAWNRHTLCHELGHALGLVHEHQRSDRDTFVTIVTNNIQAGHLFDFVILTDSQNESPYDFLSVMHYQRNAFSVNVDSNTIVPKAGYSQYLNVMGAADPVLSADDRAGMAAMYGAGPGETNLVTNTRDSGPGSLRTALYYAFDYPGTTISFNIPTSDAGFSNNVFNILPSGALPGLHNDTVLDGSTEPTNANPLGPEILLDGALCQTPSTYTSGLRFMGTNSVAHGLVINNFPECSVLMEGSNVVANTVSGCYLGIDPTGTFPVTNGFCPVLIDGGASSNLVGGTTVAARNIISGSGVMGVFIQDAGTRFNTVAGNYIGLNAAGTLALPNHYAGVEISGGAQSNRIGGDTSAARNIISGNAIQGVYLAGANTSENRIDHNYIGLNPAGSGAISNAYTGIEISSGANHNWVGPANVISGNNTFGVLIDAATNNLVADNYVGLDASGVSGVGNSGLGVGLFSGALSNVISGNVISGNANDGVRLDGAGTAGNLVAGNLIGLNASGTMAVPNVYSGVDLYNGPQFNQIGGATLQARNVISGNTGDGIFVAGSGTTSNWIAGNLVGLSAAGNAAVGNGGSGVNFYNGAAHNVVGGLGGARNFLSGNTDYGISVNYSSSDNIIQGNTIGLDSQNLNLLPNGYAAAVFYAGAQSNLFGGVTPGAANLISGSTGDGVELYDANTTNNTIRGNSIFNNAYGAIGLYNSANLSLAAPTLSSTVVTTNTTISGSYPGSSGAVYQLDFYADAPPAGSAEARTYLGSANIVGTGSAATFNIQLGVRLPSGRAVTATATDAAGNTSPLSTGIAATMTSTPNDGIPDAWRAFYFGGSGSTTNTSSYAAGDPDHDGQSNYHEFLAGTNPTNAASVLKLAVLNAGTPTDQVNLNSANGTVYRVEYRNSLSAGAWSILADQVIGDGASILLPDAAAENASRRFYRAQVLW